MTDRDVETAEIAETAAALERASLIPITDREDGEPIYTLTPAGEQVANQMAMSREDGAAELLDALLEGKG